MRFWPARLDSAQTAKILGFQEHDIPVLVACKKLTALGKPAQNAVKYFASCEIEELAGSRDWLSKSTQALYDFWKQKNSRRTAARPPQPSLCPPLSTETTAEVSLAQ